MLRIPNGGSFGQGSANWLEIRTCFVTASRAVEVVRDYPQRKARYAQQKRSEWSVDGKTYVGDPAFASGDDSFGAQVTRRNVAYGSAHEGTARENYVRALRSVYGTAHSDVRVAVEGVSFYVNRECTTLASPDGEVTVRYTARGSGEEGREFGLVEIKCPVGDFFRRNPEFDPKREITWQQYGGLLSTGKNANIPRPKFSLSALKQKESMRRTPADLSGPFAFTIENESPYKGWYIQCLVNLFTCPGEPQWIDLCIWTAPSMTNTHTWWFKNELGEPFKNLYVERFYRDDPLVLDDWGIVNQNIQAFYVEHAAMFYKNIMNCLRQWNAETQVSPDSAVEPPCDPSEAAASSQT